MQEAFAAWAEDDFPGRTLAPLAVEHLGKAVLSNANPALLVPFSQDAGRRCPSWLSGRTSTPPSYAPLASSSSWAASRRC